MFKTNCLITDKTLKLGESPREHFNLNFIPTDKMGKLALGTHIQGKEKMNVTVVIKGITSQLRSG